MTRPTIPCRTREQILAAATVVGGRVWFTCWNCGGSGDYPSSCTPPGKCRLFCWAQSIDPITQIATPKAPDDPTYGKLSLLVDEYVKREQRHDRDAYRAQQRAAKANADQAARLAQVDPRIRALADAFGLDPAHLPTPEYPSETAGFRRTAPVDRAFEQAGSLIGAWVGMGDLSDAQWELVRKLPAVLADARAKVAADAAARAASQWLGAVGERLTVGGTVEHVFSFQSRDRFSRGTRYVVKFRSAAGHVVKWFADRAPQQDACLTISGIVKAHEDYKGERQTLLQRVKITEPEGATA